MPDPHLTRLFLQRFTENDLISPDSDRMQVLAQVWATLITGGLFISVFLSLPYLNSPFPLPSRTAANVVRVQFLYASWSMTVMALLAVAVWDALALDSRDTEILGPLPIPRRVIVGAKIGALVVFAAAFIAALNVVPALIHPVLALSRLRPGALHVLTLVAAHIASTTAAAAFGFAAVVTLRELLHAVLGPRAFRRVSTVVRGALVVALVTTLLLVPVMSFRVANLWFQGAITTMLLPPMWFAGLHDVMSGFVWSEVPRPDLPPSLALSERTFESLYQTRRPIFRQLGLVGGGTFAIVLISSALAYLWNNRRLPDPPFSRAAEGGVVSGFGDGIAQRLLVRRPVVRAGYFFTLRVLARSVPNRLSIAVPLAVAIAVAIVSLAIAGVNSSLDFSQAPVAVSAVQLLGIAAIVIGFRHSVRVPADLRARWIFHLIRPAAHTAYMTGVKRGAMVKLVVPVLLAVLPLHVLTVGRRAAILHLVFGLLAALALREAALLGFRRLPFAGSYVPSANITTYGTIHVLVIFAGVYSVAWLAHAALSTTAGTVVLYVATGASFAAFRGIAFWQGRHPHDVDLDELVEPPTLRLGLMD